VSAMMMPTLLRLSLVEAIDADANKRCAIQQITGALLEHEFLLHEYVRCLCCKKCG